MKVVRVAPAHSASPSPPRVPTTEHVRVPGSMWLHILTDYVQLGTSESGPNNAMEGGGGWGGVGWGKDSKNGLLKISISYEEQMTCVIWTSSLNSLDYRVPTCRVGAMKI